MPFLEVKGGDSVTVDFAESKLIYIREVSAEKVDTVQEESIKVHVTLDKNGPFVVAHLQPGRKKEVYLVYNKKFELSHTVDGSVGFYYFEVDQPKLRRLPVSGKPGAKREKKTVGKKEEKAASKQKVKIEESAKDMMLDDDDIEVEQQFGDSRRNELARKALRTRKKAKGEKRKAENETNITTPP